MERTTQPESLPDASPQPSPPGGKETFAAYIQIVGPVFYNRAFSDKTKLLYGLLAAMTQAPRYYAFAKNSTLMRFLCCSERTLQRCLAELEEAGELTIENGTGGRTLRKIRLTRLQPFNPDNCDGVNPDKNDGGNKNKQKGNKKRGKAPSASRDDVIQWFNLWVAKQDLSQEESVALCTDLHDFVENRESVGKPFNTIKAAARMGNRLKSLTSDNPHPVPLMRYMLNKSITNNWADVFALKESDVEDFNRYLEAEYDIRVGAASAPEEYF